MKKIFLLGLLCTVTGASAENNFLDASVYHAINTKAVEKHIIPQYEKFYTNMVIWDTAVENLCANPTMETFDKTKGVFKHVAQGWSGVQALNFGSITYFDSYKKFDLWPDKKSFIKRNLKKTLKNKNNNIQDKIMGGSASPAVMSFNTSERLLFKMNEVVINDAYACDLLRTQSKYAVQRAGQVLNDWKSTDGYRTIFIGEDAETVEAHIMSTNELYKASMLGLQLIVDKAIGEPLSINKKKGRPYFAQYPYSRTSKIAIQGMYNSSRDLVLNIFKSVIITQNGHSKYNRLVRMFDKGQMAIDTLNKDIFILASSKEGREKLAHVQKTISMVKSLSVREINMALGLTLGFNGLDGD